MALTAAVGPGAVDYVVVNTTQDAQVGEPRHSLIKSACERADGPAAGGAGVSGCTRQGRARHVPCYGEAAGAHTPMDGWMDDVSGCVCVCVCVC